MPFLWVYNIRRKYSILNVVNFNDIFMITLKRCLNTVIYHMIYLIQYMDNAPVNVNHQCPHHRQTQGILTFYNFLSKYPPSFAPYVSESPLFPTLGNLFILNVRTTPGSEHHCHKPLGRMSESCQNPLGCPYPRRWKSLYFKCQTLYLDLNTIVITVWLGCQNPLDCLYPRRWKSFYFICQNYPWVWTPLS